MREMPLTIGTIHFVGIGGIGMSGIAEILHNLGYSVQGSDLSENANVARLRKLGVPIEIGHRRENIGDSQVVVISSAVRPDNPEVLAARTRQVPVVRRAEMLAELMRLKWAVAVGGTHGKTTTTSLIAAMLDAAGYDPTVINGGVINAYGTNARLGAGEWMIVEADESDGTFVKLPSTIAVVTNIDPEHMDFYGDFDRLKDAFRTFVENIPFYGFAVLCIDHPEVQALIGQISDRRLVTYGFSPQAEIRAIDAGCGPDGCRFSVAITRGDEQRLIKNVRLPMYGEHNMLNSLAAMAVGLEMGLEEDVIVRGLSEFEGVKRRFTRTGEVNGVTIIDDYGHHPVEIASVLKAARSATTGQVVAVVQPHRYSRLQNLFEEFCACFNDADTVIVADVYAAGEEPIPGVDRDALIAGLRAHGHRHVEALDSEGDLPRIIAELAKPGDMVVCLGAGTISGWANALPERLATLYSGANQ
ncbi:MAG: UDP-N-acetylmuramate--L-alanine ligase [Rhodospirillales bacterium]|nr:MAG: UDP-N-acetylmuramate--L-alanine ligase [Rhodospirillales bacterium]